MAEFEQGRYFDIWGTPVEDTLSHGAPASLRGVFSNPAHMVQVGASVAEGYKVFALSSSHSLEYTQAVAFSGFFGLAVCGVLNSLFMSSRDMLHYSIDRYPDRASLACAAANRNVARGMYVLNSGMAGGSGFCAFAIAAVVASTAQNMSQLGNISAGFSMASGGAVASYRRAQMWRQVLNGQYGLLDYRPDWSDDLDGPDDRPEFF